MTREMKTVGVVGLGAMGGPMAANLVKAGYDVVGYNRSAAPMDRLVALGGRKAASLPGLAVESDALITVLPDTPDVDEVLLGPNGALEHCRPGSVIIDMSTVDPALAGRIADEAEVRGLFALDAPVSGGEKGAIDGTLAIMVGGRPDAFGVAEPILNAMGSTVVFVGPPGSGQRVKAANQLLVGGIIELVAEAIVFLEAYGVSLEPAIEVLSGGLAGSRVLERKAANMVERKFPASFRAELHHKDMGILVRAAREADVPLPLGATVAQMFTALKRRGGGGLDHSALITVLDALCSTDHG